MVDIKDLVNPEAGAKAMHASRATPQQRVSDLERMILIREIEFQIGEAYKKGHFSTPIHLCVGQEAVPVGIARHLNNRDAVFGGHRSHAQFLSVSERIQPFINEIFCRKTGLVGGRGGSMHLWSGPDGFQGSVPLVGATIPLAVGAALTAKLAHNDSVAVCYFGDGACEEGVLHESLNFAAVMNLPVLFVVENNLYSSHLDINLRQPSDRTARFADAHCVRNATVDGNDIEAVSNAAEVMIEQARDGKGPGFLEAVTFRWLGHVGPEANIDVGLRRSEAEIESWKKRDPIKRLAQDLIDKGNLSSLELDKMKNLVRSQVLNYIDIAKNEPLPEPNSVLYHVYGN